MSAFIPRHLLLPVETQNREFDSKLLVALMACKHGWLPIIGSRAYLHERLHRLPPSIYFSKGVRSGSKPVFRLLRKFGHVAVALDEEGLLRWPEDVLLTMMLDREVFNFPRLLFAWGESNAETWRKFPDYQGAPIIETGNPRIDLLRPELRGYHAAEAARIRETYGDFVLFSSNFSVVNHFIPNQVRFRVAKHADKSVAGDTRDELVAHKRCLYQAFQDMLPQLARALAPVNLVVRPHPSENRDSWRAAMAGIANVHVLHEGPIAPWLMAARALVHSSCTTAVEAAVVGTPAFSFRPVVSQRFDQPLSNGLSACHDTAESIIPAIVRTVQSSERSELSSEQKQLINHHIASLNGPLSAERILSAMDENRARLATRRRPLLWLSGLLAHHKWRKSKLERAASRSNKSSRHYTEHKFSGISLEDIQTKAAAFRALLPDLPEVEFTEISENIFELKLRDAGTQGRG